MNAQPFAVIEELECAGRQLRTILDQYVSICSKMDNLLSAVLLDVPQRCLQIISTEMSRSLSYELKSRQAKAIICRVRNRVTQLVPITSLPPEILAHIFQLTAKPCDLKVIDGIESNSNSNSDSDSGSNSDYDSESSLATGSSEDRSPGSSRGSESGRDPVSQPEKFPTHPVHLTHVCSRWRQTAIGVPSLWTHIDYMPHKLLPRGSLTRAETYLARAGQLPVELHVADSDHVSYNKASLRRFLSSIRQRVKSLNIFVNHRWRKFHFHILNEIFRVDPTILAKLTTCFTMPDTELDEFIHWHGNVNGLSRLRVLHLRGLFPAWGNTAYHYLVDLRLAASADLRWTCVPEQQLQNILEASPGLRILHFSLRITDQKGDDESVIPVPLKDLEVLNIRTDRGVEAPVLKLGHILRLISPGSKPLRLSIWHKLYILNFQEDHSADELAHFFQRANVVKFCAKGVCPLLNPLTCYSPNLEDLVLDSCVFPWRSNYPFLWKGSTEAFRLNSLILHDCSPAIEQLDLLLHRYPAKRLILAKFDWTHIETTLQCDDPVRRVSELMEKYPGTELIMQSSNPTAEWDTVI